MVSAGLYDGFVQFHHLEKQSFEANDEVPQKNHIIYLFIYLQFARKNQHSYTSPTDSGAGIIKNTLMVCQWLVVR